MTDAAPFMRRGPWLLAVAFALGWGVARLTSRVSSEAADVGAVDGATGAGTGAGEDPDALRNQVAELRKALAEARAGRDQREREWLEFTRAMAGLEVEGAPDPPAFLDLGPRGAADAGEESGDAAADEAQPDPALERAQVLRRDLMGLLLGERVQGMDILEVGRVGQGFTGPVVVRLLDDRGRPTGTLACERLRLECSRAARNVTLVFEEGYERYGEQVLVFGEPSEELTSSAELGGARSLRRSGTRRVDLEHVDPQPWIDLLPELFDAEDVAALPDDGRWNRMSVVREFNRLLGETTRGGRWRVRELAGVVGGTLRGVHLVQLDERERPLQRIFADRLRIESEGTGVLLLLEDGVSERNGRRAPFLDGRYRIFLPAAPLEAWRTAALPSFLSKDGQAGAAGGEVVPGAGQRG